MSELDKLFCLMREYETTAKIVVQLKLFVDGSGELDTVAYCDNRNRKNLFCFLNIPDAVTQLNKLLNPPKEYVIICEYLLVNLYGPNIITHLLTLKEAQDLLNTPEYRSNSAYRYCLKKVINV
jgi:hypothetical protein